MEFLYLITGLTVGVAIAFVLIKNKTNEIAAALQEKEQATTKIEQLQLALKEKEIELARKQDLILDAKQRGYNIQQVLDNFIEPDLPEETIRIGLSGEWVSYDG